MAVNSQIPAPIPPMAIPVTPEPRDLVVPIMALEMMSSTAPKIVTYRRPANVRLDFIFGISELTEKISHVADERTNGCYCQRVGR
jgi:hypothetical protein